MKYRWVCWPVLLAFITGCGGNGKKLNERLTFWRKDKIPYGSFYAYENLQHIFPNASRVVIDKKSPDKYHNMSFGEAIADTEPTYEGKQAYIIIASTVRPDQREAAALLNLAQSGKHVFISSLWIGQNLLDTLGLNTALYTGYTNDVDSLTVSVNNPVTNQPATFSYPGMALDNYFNKMDSTVTAILGTNDDGKANFVRIAYSTGGAIYLHLAPTALTNFFLLHKNNKTYYDNVLSYLPVSTDVVHWDEYFRYHANGEGGDRSTFSALGWIRKQPGLSVAWWLALLLLLLIFLFESKRKQRMIPVIAPLKNASLDFVKTIGRLYFQRKDNRNLAHKMGAHFLDHVRNRYNIRTSAMDEDFVKRLAYKSACDHDQLKDMVYQLKLAQDDFDVSDETLLDLHRKLEEFYKKA